MTMSNESSRISIGIPTARRPDMLRSALQSVANQSRLDLISEVLVSENGGDAKSLDVCREFPQLPIRYITQTKLLEPYNHFLRVVESLNGIWVALLGDDDMWGRYHLEEAWCALSSNTDAIGYVGQAVIVGNESRQVLSGYGRLFPSIIEATSESFAPYWRWNSEDLLMDSLCVTPLNLWSLVGRKKEILQSMDVFRPPSGLDADRLMWWELARQGTLIVGREVSLFYRVHQNSACKQFQKSDPDFHFRKSYEYSYQMIREAEEDGLDWKTRWLKNWAQLSKEQQVNLWGNGIAGAKAALAEILGSNFIAPDSGRVFAVKVAAKQLLPPILFEFLVSLKRKLTH